MLFEIWETSLKLNGLIRRFGALKEEDAPEKPLPLHDRRQMSLLDCLM